MADRVSVAVLGTSDLHGHVLNWDYYRAAEYADPWGNHVGLAKVSTVVTRIRADRGPRSTVLIDAGDTLQGTPLAHYYATIEPATGAGGPAHAVHASHPSHSAPTHPMARVMNHLHYDAAALGNHEFNYGIDFLRAFERQLDFPLLAANAVDPTGEPAFAPYTVLTVEPDGEPIRIGVLGLTNPGVAIWDRANVEGRLTFPGLVEQAAIVVPRLRAEGVDVVVVAAHSGADTSSSYGDALPVPENAATLLAEQVPGIDAILVGHAHVEIGERVVTNVATGRPVVLTEPACWGMRVSVIDIDLERHHGRWNVTSVRAQVLDTADVAEDRAVADLVGPQHDTVRRHVDSVIGSSTAPMSLATARYEPTSAMAFVARVQAEWVADAVRGTAHAALPVLAIVSPYNRHAVIPAGAVTIRDLAGLYTFENTVVGIRMTGAQVLDYLESAATYYRSALSAGPHAPGDLTNAPTDLAPHGVPDYDADALAGLHAPVAYDIDLAAPVGRRIRDLTYHGEPVRAGQDFVVAVNSYRHTGAGGLPHVARAPVVVNRFADLRGLLIDWVRAEGTIDPAGLTPLRWRLVAGGEPIVVREGSTIGGDTGAGGIVSAAPSSRLRR